MSTAPHEICRRLGETKFKEMFLALNAAAMKQSLSEAGLSATRTPGQTSTRKRNEEWAKRIWNTLGSAKPAPCQVLLFEWLRQTRSGLLTTFLDALGVAHQGGLTDADFMAESKDEQLQAAAQTLLAHPDYDQREVAAYLLFLDHTNKTDKFAEPVGEIIKVYPRETVTPDCRSASYKGR